MPDLFQLLAPPPAAFARTPGVAAFAIAATWVNTCVLVTGGHVKCWGFNDYGQLGIGSTTQQNSPVDVVLGEGGHRGQACDVRPK